MIDIKEKDLISIIVPVFNVEKYLKRCLDSLIMQTYKNIEIILIDDGSTDNSRNICDDYEKKDGRIIVVHQTNAGVSKARNVGLKIANGEYIAFADSDDYVELNIYEKLYTSIIDSKSDIGICNMFPSKNFNDLPDIIDANEALGLILDKEKFQGYMWNKLYKKDIIREQKFDEQIHICEDLLFNCEYLSKCQKCSILDESLYYYIRRNDSAVNNNYDMKKITSLKAYEKILQIYINITSPHITKVQMCYIKEYSVARYVIKLNKANIIPEEEKEIKMKAKKIIYDIMHNKKIRTIKKITLLLYYMFPIQIQRVRRSYYKLNKNKR